ncbi:MAG: acetyltransferase [Mobilitalea sp.]
MQQSRKIILLGAGGHCQSVADSLINLSLYDEIGLVGNAGTETVAIKDTNNKIMGLKQVGNDDHLERLYQEGYTDAFIAVGSIGDITVRITLYNKLKQIGFHIPNVIDHSSVVSSFASLGEGIYIGKNAVVNAYATIGNCAIINTSSIIEHQCNVGDFVHIASGSVLCGNVNIAAGTHIGAGSIIKQGIHVGAGTMIGMGSVVLKDIGDNVTAYGNPCKVYK